MLRKAHLALIFIFVFGSVSKGADQPSISPAPALPAATRGQTVIVSGSNFPTQGMKVYLRTGKEKAGDKGTVVDALTGTEGRSFSFKIPAEPFETGRYLVYVDFGSTELAIPGDLTVLPDVAAKVQINSIAPTTVYPNDNNDGYDFDISGANLAKTPNDNILEVASDGPQAVGTPEECKAYAASKVFKKPCLSYEPGMETRRLSVKGFHPAYDRAPIEFQLRVNGNLSEAKSLTFSRFTAPSVRFLAVVVSLVLAAIVLGLVWKGIGIYRIDDQSYSPAASFLLDKETNSYSLSKFQLLAWTGVAVFAYIFAFLCHLLIQWNFSFPTIPSGWPTLLGLSAGTTVAAISITSNRGSKGAGPVLPSTADFICTGGLVASDRFQFFIWTLVGCAGFLALVLLQDPSAFKDLPDVPSGFLYLMGISATGYLGGKLIRLPGPVVAKLLVSGVVPSTAVAPANMTIDLQGENLSKDASVKVDDVALRPDQYSIVPVKTQDQSPDSSFCAELTLTLKDATAYVEGVHRLSLTNKDGQMVESDFPADALTIDPNQVFLADTQPVAVVVKGKNFADGMTAQWTDQAQTISDIPATAIKQISDTQLTVTLTPGPKGKGKFLLISAFNLRARADVQVS
jgi:hypothetical protein